MVVLTVEQVLVYLKELIEGNLPLADLWIQGEISNLSRSAAGHVYFTLKDGAGQLRCAFFRRQNSGMALEHGAAVLAHGYVSIYQQRGELNFIVDFVHPQGAGILHAQLERLKEKLEAEGLFDEARKRPLPPFPRRIGVATSSSGAVLHDIRTVAGRRWPLATIVLAPTPVQGDDAPPAIAAAIAGLDQRGNVDVIIVARGGGSLEELWAFNDERVTRAIFASRTPVVSAIGHETDFTLADYVADVRAPTPSAAAELVAPDQIEVAMRVGAYTRALESCACDALTVRRDALARTIETLAALRPDVDGPRERVAALLLRAAGVLTRAAQERRTAVETRSLQLASLSPLAVLERGYAVVHHENGGLVRGAADVAAGNRLSVRLHDGGFAAEVRERRER